MSSEIWAEFDAAELAQLDHLPRENQFAKMTEEEQRQQKDRARRQRSLSDLISDLRPRAKTVRRGRRDLFICPFGGGESVVHIDPDLAEDQVSCECGDGTHTEADLEEALRMQVRMLPRKCTDEDKNEFNHYRNCQTCKIWSAADNKFAQAFVERFFSKPKAAESDEGEGQDPGPVPECTRYHPSGDDRSQCLTCATRREWTKQESLRGVQNLRLERLRQAASEGVDSPLLARFPIYSASEVAARDIPLDSCPGLLGPPGTVTEVTGYRGSAKSMVVHQLAQAVAHYFKEIFGLPLRWHGPVLHVAREGVPGWTRRVRAWEVYHDLPVGEGVRFMHDKIDVTKPEDLAALSAILTSMQARLLVLDPVSMVGGGREDEENYQEVRAAALALASDLGIVVVLLTNTGHAIRTRGRNSSMLADGMDVSIALIKDEKTGHVEFFPNKGRDMGAIDYLKLVFEGAGDRDPDTGKHLSGVWRPVTPEEEKEARADEVARDLEALNRALDHASRVLLECCKCAQGDAGAEKYPLGCSGNGGGGATNDQMAVELGLALDDRHRSRLVKDALMPAVKQGLVRSVGQTKGLRWHWGRGADAHVKPKH